MIWHNQEQANLAIAIESVRRQPVAAAHVPCIVAGMSEQLYFDTVREDRGSYYVEYQPPVSDHRFGTLNLVFPGPVENDEIVRLMESELRDWIARYPVPLMVWAWDPYEDMIQPKGIDGQLVGWPVPGSNEIVLSWKIEDLTAYDKTAPPLPDWRNIYKDIPFRTDAQVKSDANKNMQERRRQVRILQVVFTLWFLVIPAGYAIFEYFGPEWFAVLVLIYTLWKLGRAWLKLMGYGNPSPADEEKAGKDLKMRHYFHHCERNPDGFSKLRAENFKEDARARIEKEAAEVAQAAKRRSN